MKYIKIQNIKLISIKLTKQNIKRKYNYHNNQNLRIRTILLRMLLDKKAAKPVKPIFSIEEMNKYDQHEQAHKLQITSKLASSRFLAASEGQAVATHASIGESSSGLLQGPGHAGSIESYMQYAGSQGGSGAGLPDEQLRISRAAAASVGAQKLARPNGKPRKVTAAPPTYAQRMARAQKVQADRDREERRAQRALRKQEKQFHKMMAKLKSQQEKGSRDASSQSSSQSSETSESGDERARRQGGQHAGTVADSGNIEAEQKGAGTAWSEGQERARSLNVTEAPRSLANPFENTPHGDIVANYLDESRHLQTLHLSSDLKDQRKVLEDVRSVGVASTHQALGTKFSQLYDSSRLWQDSGARDLPVPSLGSREDTERKISQDLYHQSSGPPGGGTRKIDEIKIQVAGGAPLDQDIHFGTPSQERVDPWSHDLHLRGVDGSKVGLNDGQELDQSFQKKQRSWVTTQDGNASGRKFAFALGQLPGNKYLVSPPTSRLDPRLPRALHSRYESGSQTGLRGLNLDGSSNNAQSPTKPGAQGLNALTMVRGPKFQRDLDALRRSQNVPLSFKGQSDINAEYFKHCFDEAAKNYSFLLEPSKKTGRHRRVHQSMNLSDIKDAVSSSSRLILPSINQSQALNSACSSKLGQAGASGAIKPAQQQFHSPMPERVAPSLQKLDVGMTAKPSAIQNQLVRLENSLSRFNCAYMKSPKLQSELIKCQQLLNMKSRFLAQPRGVGLPQPGRQAQLNTRDKLKQIYNYQAAEQQAPRGQTTARLQSERNSSQAARATPSMQAAAPGELEGATSSQDLHASPERTVSRDESQENGQNRESPFMRMTGSAGQKSSAARPKESTRKQSKARFVSFSQHEVSNPISHERSTDSVGRGSRTSKANPQSSPKRKQQKEKKPFKSEQQLELERKQREEEAFARFVKEYEKPRDAVMDPSEHLELYKLQGVQELIQLADHLVKYREYKADLEKERIAKMSAQERRTLEMVVQAKKHPRPVTINRTVSTSPRKKMAEMAMASPQQKDRKTMPGTEEKRQTKIAAKQARSKSISSLDSDQQIAGDAGAEKDQTTPEKAARAKTIGKRVNREKRPDLCVVQKKALKFMHNQFKDDSRYEVDPEEEQRVKFFDLPDIEAVRRHFSEAQRKELFASAAQIDCEEHSEQEDEEVEFVQLLYGKLAAFYGDLLDERHNKVALEKLCCCFVDQIKEKNDYSFRDLRQRILSFKDVGCKSFYLKLRQLNPEMFLKAEKPSEEPEAQLMQSSHKDQVEVLDAREHHRYSFNPMRQVQVNRLIFETLIKGMVDAEFGTENAKLAQAKPKSCTNKLLDANMRRREQEKERQQMLKRMSRSGIREEAADSAPTVPGGVKKMHAGLLETFSQKLEDQKHFQDQIQRTINFKKPQIAVNKGTNSKSKVEKAQKSAADTINEESGHQPPAVVQQDSQWLQKQGSRIQELFHKEYQKQKFYAEQKHFSKNPSLNPGSQTDFYMQLNEDEKHCLVMPYFTMIQQHTLHLRDQFFNSRVVKALAAFIEAQTAQCIKKLTLKAQDVDLEEDHVEEEAKQLRELKASRVLIETLSIDSCRMEDEDLALLLSAIARQGRLKSLTIANDHLGQASIAVLEQILTQKFKQTMIEVVLAEDAEPTRVDANPFQPLEFLNLTNLKCNRSQCLSIATVLAETAISWPLKSIKLSGLDLSDQAISTQVGTQFEVNPGLLRLDLSYSRMFPQQLACFTKYLAQEASNAENIKLQYLGLGYININTEGPDQEAADGRVANQIVEDLCAFIGSSKNLLHLDLSGMNLQERVFDILSSVRANEAQALAAIHLHDNRFSLEQKDRVLRVMGIETNNYHHLKDSLNLHEHDTIGHTILSRHYIKQGKIQNMAHKFFKGDADAPSKEQQSLLQKEKRYQLKVLNNELNQEMKESKKQIDTDVVGGSSRDRAIKDPMILTRKIGQPELIFNDRAYCLAELNAANSEERWTYNDSVSGDDCYVCQQHSYVQIFFNREKAYLDFQRVEEAELREILKSSYDLDRDESLQRGAPILLSSVNNWVLTRFLDVKIFSQLLKGEAGDFILQSAVEQQREYKEQIDRERERLAQKTKTKTQPKMPMGAQKKNDPDEEALSLLEEESSYVETKFVEDEVQAAKNRVENIRRCISRKGSATFNALVGINSLQSAKPYDATDGARAPLSSRSLKKSKALREEVAQDDIVDRVAGREWREILKKYQASRKDIVSFNQPPLEGADGEIFIFAGFVKPGRHAIVIFDPLLGEFFRKDVIVEARPGELPQPKAKRPKPSEPDEERAEDMDDFAFRDWRKDDEDTIQHVLSVDLNRDSFSSANMQMSRKIFFNVKELLSVIYHRLLDAYKIYLSLGSFPSSSLQKFFTFLKDINVVHGRSKAANLKKLMTEEEVLSKFYAKDEQVTKDLMKSHIVYRHEFVRVLFSVGYQNFRRSGYEQQMRFLDYCGQTIVPAIRTYIKKRGGSHRRYRHKYIWTKPVSGVIQANRGLLKRMYGKYKSQGKFTVASALHMLRDMKVVLDRLEDVPHEEMVRRLFGSSQQTQSNEDDLYFYGFLTEVEFCELIVRLSAEVYHQSYAAEGDAEDAEEAAVPRGRLATVQGDQRATLKLRLLVMEPLELKVYELLLTDFAAALDDVTVKDLEGAAPEESLAKKRKALQGASLDQLKKMKAAADAELEAEGKTIKITAEASSDEFEGEPVTKATTGPDADLLESIPESP